MLALAREASIAEFRLAARSCFDSFPGNGGLGPDRLVADKDHLIIVHNKDVGHLITRASQDVVYQLHRCPNGDITFHSERPLHSELIVRHDGRLQGADTVSPQIVAALNSTLKVFAVVAEAVNSEAMAVA